MDRGERAVEAINEAKNLGLRPEFDSGLVVVKLTATGDLEEQRAAIAKLTKSLFDVRRLLERSAIADRARKFVGQQVCSQELGVGTLKDASEDGTLMISTGTGVESRQLTTTANADSLLIILDEATPSIEAPEEGDKKRGGMLSRFLGNS